MTLSYRHHRVKCTADADALQADLNRLAEWSRVWRLKLNPSKCNVISFTLRKSPIAYAYSLNDTVLERRSETRDLGVILDSKLTFASHVGGLNSVQGEPDAGPSHPQ